MTLTLPRRPAVARHDPAAAALRRRLRPLHAAVFLQGFLLWVPVEKLFMTELGFDAAAVGVTAAAYSANGPAARTADRHPRRPVEPARRADPLQRRDRARRAARRAQPERHHVRDLRAAVRRVRRLLLRHPRLGRVRHRAGGNRGRRRLPAAPRPRPGGRGGGAGGQRAGRRLGRRGAGPAGDLLPHGPVRARLDRRVRAVPRAEAAPGGRAGGAAPAPPADRAGGEPARVGCCRSSPSACWSR